MHNTNHKNGDKLNASEWNALANDVNLFSSANNKEYNSQNHSGLGKKTLELKNGTNILTLDDFDKTNTIYIIENDFDLNDSSIEIPSNSILEFNGGSLDNGFIIGNNTNILADNKNIIFGKDIIISGTWNVAEIYDEWFEYTENMVSNLLIKNILALTSDNVNNKVYIVRNTTYHVEFTPPEELCLEEPYFVTTGQLKNSDGTPKFDEHNNPVYADGSASDRANLYWTLGGYTKSIYRYCNYFKYPGNTLYLPDRNNLYVKLGVIATDPQVIEGITIFWLKSNTDIILDSCILMLNHKLTAYYMFNACCKENLSITGTGKIFGEITENYDITYKWPGGSLSYETYWMYYGEWGYLLWLSGALNVTIKGITLGGAFGDCIYFNPDVKPCITNGTLNDNPPVPTKNIIIEDVIIDRARRNGITCCGVNVFINNVTFKNCGLDSYGGTPPKCGIDFESDFLHVMWNDNNQTLRSIADRFFPDSYNDLGCRNVIMSDCKFENNAHDISSTTPQYHYDTHFDFEPGAITISNCNFTSFLRLNSTNCIRFRNCYIDKITSYDDTTDPMSYTTCLEYENCVFGDNLASRYFAYANKSINAKYPAVRFDNCRGRTLYEGKETIYYSGITDSVIEVRIPFVYDDRIVTSELFKYKINRGVMHIKILQCGALSVRTTECDMFISDYPRIYNTKYFGGEYMTAEEDSNYISICSIPKVVTDSVNHTQYISFYIASGDVLNRYYNYDTYLWTTTPSGSRPYSDKDIIIEMQYLGVPDNRGNLIRSVRTGNWRLDLRNGIYSGIDILANRVDSSDFTQIDGYIFNYTDWNDYTVIDPKTSSGEYITRFPKILTNNGTPVDEASLPNRDVYSGLNTGEYDKILYGMQYSSRFNCGLMVRGNILSKVDTSSVYLKKAMSKSELSSVLLHSKYNIMFESGLQVFITDEGTYGTLCTIYYDPTHLTLRFYLDGVNSSDVVITLNDRVKIYFFGKVIEFDVMQGMTNLLFITTFRNKIKEVFNSELVNDITVLPTSNDEHYAQQSTVGRMLVIDEDPTSTRIFVKYANLNNIYAYTGSLRIIHSINNLPFLGYAGLTAEDDFTIIKGDGTLVTKFWVNN